MKDKGDVLDAARTLGYAIIESEEYKELLKAEEDFYNDIELVGMIEKASSLESAELDEAIDEHKTMKNLKIAKARYDKLFKNINNLISYITDDESRVKLNDKKGCGSGCSGCRKK